MIFLCITLDRAQMSNLGTYSLQSRDVLVPVASKELEDLITDGFVISGVRSATRINGSFSNIPSSERGI